MADAAAAIVDMDLGADVEADAAPREYDPPETTAPEGVEQGDYLNAQKARRQHLNSAGEPHPPQ